MNRRNNWYWAVGKAIVCLSGFWMAATPGFATENARERRDARDVKQDSRQEAHSAKVDCRQANQKSNAACRHDKRETKQDGRQESRDVRSGAPKK